jgi:hypothetical protein
VKPDGASVMGRTLRALLWMPLRDTLRGMDRAIGPGGLWALPLLMLGVGASWWLYVPLHELFHAWGCLIAGGTVSRLEIDEIYGAAWLAHWFPYVTPGSDYAGRLSGFDTGGNDLVYLCTVFFPYLLTILVGVPALSAASTSTRTTPLLFGAAVPWALTPFLSLTGDYYEIGSILISGWLAPWLPETSMRWRGDDLFLLFDTLFGPAGNGTWVDVAGMTAALLLGAVLALITYALGKWPYARRPSASA